MIDSVDGRRRAKPMVKCMRALTLWDITVPHPPAAEAAAASFQRMPGTLGPSAAG